MNAAELYARLERDFPLGLCDDDWSEMRADGYVTPQYLERFMGLVCDNAETVNRAYTAVFPSPEVVGKILGDGSTDALLFVHHPMDYDINRRPVFFDIPAESMRALKERRVSLYNLHAPLDANGPYSTGYSLAAALGIWPEDEFYTYHKVKIGVIGRTDCETIAELKKRFEQAVGHGTAFYNYGAQTIKDGKVALIAGGGNMADVYPELAGRGVNTFVTGIANMRNGYPPSVKAHKAAKEAGVNILAGTHYSTEKFACIAMAGYFNSLGIPVEFVPGKPCLDDM